MERKDFEQMRAQIQRMMGEFLKNVTGHRNEPVSPSKTHLHQMEVDYGKFERTLHIPCAIDVNEIKASYREGFLMVTLPKKQEPVIETVEVIFR